MEYLLLLISITTVINSVLLLKLIKKEQPDILDTSLYEAQIKNLKRIIRLNEKHIKQLKDDNKAETTVTTEPEEQKRVY